MPVLKIPYLKTSYFFSDLYYSYLQVYKIEYYHVQINTILGGSEKVGKCQSDKVRKCQRKKCRWQVVQGYSYPKSAKVKKSPLSVLRTSYPRRGQERMVNSECRIVKKTSTALPETV